MGIKIASKDISIHALSSQPPLRFQVPSFPDQSTRKKNASLL